MKFADPIALKHLPFNILFFENVIMKQLQREKKKKRKECTAQSVAKTNLKTERIENYGERQIYTVKQFRLHRKTKKLFFFLP